MPSIVISALYGAGTDAFFPLALDVFDRWRTRISTGILNRWLSAITFRHPPPRTSSGKEVKLKWGHGRGAMQVHHTDQGAPAEFRAV